MPTMTERQVAHVWRRLGFGPTADDVTAGVAVGPQAVIDDLLTRPVTTPAQWNFTSATDWQGEDTWVGQWLAAAAKPANPLQERLAWTLMGLVVAGIDGTTYFNEIRDHILRIRTSPGAFYDQLLMDLAVMPGLAKYLTAHLNMKGHPNQNLARELMELFTLGRVHPTTGAANYTETDVQEVARALTGYRLDWSTGTITFDPTQWDNGNKTFLGAARGAAKLSDVIAAITTQPSWGYYVPHRLYVELVGTEPTTQQLDALVSVWGTHGNIASVVAAIAHDPAFLDANNMATKIRTPIELIAAAARVLQIDVSPISLTWQLRDLMGQHPLLPPNVAGWPSGTRWLSTSVLLTWSSVLQMLVSASYSVANGPIAKLLAVGAAAAPAEAVRLTCLTEVTPGTQQAIVSYVSGGSWTQDRAAGTLAVCMMSPEYFVN
jgi:uncharacterized protein (DUF1800 family)